MSRLAWSLAMSLRNTRVAYGWAAIALHWISAVGVTVLYLLGEQMEEAPDRAAKLAAVEDPLAQTVGFAVIHAEHGEGQAKFLGIAKINGADGFVAVTLDELGDGCGFRMALQQRMGVLRSGGEHYVVERFAVDGECQILPPDAVDARG